MLSLQSRSILFIPILLTFKGIQHFRGIILDYFVYSIKITQPFLFGSSWSKMKM